MVEMRNPAPWKPSTIDQHYLETMVAAGVLSANTDPQNPVWIAPATSHAELAPPPGYIVSLVRLHERGFGIPAGRFVRAMCHHYGVELHNFAPNAISQAVVFVAVCKGYLGVQAHWNLWRHLFCGELFTEGLSKGVRRPVRAGGLMIHVREGRKDQYIPSAMTSNNHDWDRGWFYLRPMAPGFLCGGGSGIKIPVIKSRSS